MPSSCLFYVFILHRFFIASTLIICILVLYNLCPSDLVIFFIRLWARGPCSILFLFGRWLPPIILVRMLVITQSFSLCLIAGCPRSFSLSLIVGCPRSLHSIYLSGLACLVAPFISPIVLDRWLPPIMTLTLSLFTWSFGCPFDHFFCC
jgi:hypothetical protein